MSDFLQLLSPGLWLIIGALALPFIPGKLRAFYSMFLALIGLASVLNLQTGQLSEWHLLGETLIYLRVDTLSKLFGTVFCISAAAAFLYAAYMKRAVDHLFALFYIGSALGVVFAGDLLTLYMFWEVMAVASAILILARRTERSLAAAKRYILVHVFGGLVLLAGILLHWQMTGSLVFNSFQYPNLATWLILIGFLVNAAAIPFSSWLPDSYPEATVMGAVVLSAFTSKTAVYTLIRGFPGWEILIWLGAAMAIYGIIYAILENNIRRLLSYSIVNQVGFMLVAIGIGSKLAIAGAAAHAFAHIIYKGLLMMVAGVVIYRTGKEKFTDLGGLAKHMPWTLGFGIVGALTISAFPFTSSYTTKSIIMKAVESAHAVGPWLVLEVAAAAEIVACSLPFIYFIFFGKATKISKDKLQDAPLTMKVAMAVLSALCLGIGFFPELLYQRLPNAMVVLQKVGTDFVDLYLHHPAYVLTKIQMLSFAGLVFFLFLPLLKRKESVTVDIDWLYRKGGYLVYRGLDMGLNSINAWMDNAVRIRLIGQLGKFFRCAPIHLLVSLMTPVWLLRYTSTRSLNAKRREVTQQLITNTTPLGMSSAWILFGLLVLLLIA